jgi:hypothetical protein
MQIGPKYNPFKREEKTAKLVVFGEAFTPLHPAHPPLYSPFSNPKVHHSFALQLFSFFRLPSSLLFYVHPSPYFPISWILARFHICSPPSAFLFNLLLTFCVYVTEP